MKNVAETLHLQKRGGVWHYYRRVPLHLVPIVGRRFFKKSLKTADIAQARKLRTVEDLKVDALLSAAEQQGVTTVDSHASVDFGTLVEYVRQTVSQLDEKSAEQMAIDPPQSAAEAQERWKEADYDRWILTNPDDPRRDEWVYSMSNRVLKKAGATPLDAETDAKFAEVVRRGLLELARRRADRLQDCHERQFYDALFDPARPPAVPFSELAKVFVAQVEEEHRENAIGQKWTDKIKAHVKVLLEIVGKDFAVHKIDDDVVQRVRSLLARTPSNRHKIYPDLSLEQAIEKAKADKRELLSPTTQSVYLDTFRNMLAVGVKKKFLAANPAEDIQPLKRDAIPADQKRLPFRADQLKGFFEGTFYRSCSPATEEPYSKPDRAWRFWFPLIMLFSGARPNEIAQLLITDVKQTEKGTWFLDLVNEVDDADNSDDLGEAKKLKTLASRRQIPVHSELMRIGFLEFVEERASLAKQEAERLFPELKPNRYDNLAWYPSKRFNECFLPLEIKVDKRQCLYSLRHNVRDALRRAKAPDETLLAVTGWSPNGKAVSTDYGDFRNPDLHVEWVEKIYYENLDLSFLYALNSKSI
jgi:hypothetical protein